MRELQQHIIEELSVRAQIDVKDELARRIAFLREYLLASSASGLVLGISGGQDSSLAGKLCQLAVEELRDTGHEARFVAVRLPHGAQRDEDDAQLALRFIAPDETLTVNIEPAVQTLDQSVSAVLAEPLEDFHRGNVKARIRMVTQYAIAGQRRMLVVGTDHAAEGVTGFFTKFGDGGADVLPLAGLTKAQGAELLRELGAPAALWQKVPTADLLDTQPGQSDESSLGVSYSAIDAYLRGESVEPQDAERIERWFVATRHKRHLPVTPQDTWWKEH